MSTKFREAVKRDHNAIQSLLERTKLPTEAVDSGAAAFYVGESDGIIVGAAGFEFYGNDALLRSVAVEPSAQRRGLGSEIVDFMVDLARQKKLRNVVLLTETAKGFFAKKNFQVIDRSSVENEAMKQSPEFTYACPKSAVCMILGLR